MSPSRPSAPGARWRVEKWEGSDEMKTTCAALVLMCALGCRATPEPNEMSLRVAQDFHTYIHQLTAREGYCCMMLGFPEWGTRGMEPSLEPVGRWQFTTDDLESPLQRIVLIIRLVPARGNKSTSCLSTWRGYDIEVEERRDQKDGHTSATPLIEAIRRGKP